MKNTLKYRHEARDTTMMYHFIARSQHKNTILLHAPLYIKYLVITQSVHKCLTSW